MEYNTSWRCLVRRRWLLFGVLMATALGVASLMRAVADNFDPDEKHCAQNLKRLWLASQCT